MTNRHQSRVSKESDSERTSASSSTSSPLSPCCRAPMGKLSPAAAIELRSWMPQQSQTSVHLAHCQKIASLVMVTIVSLSFGGDDFTVSSANFPTFFSLCLFYLASVVFFTCQQCSAFLKICSCLFLLPCLVGL